MPTSELVKQITWLLPGFVAAWVFYGLTAHPRKDMFERTVQALIFTGLIQTIVYLLKKVTFFIYKSSCFNFGAWFDETWSDEATSVLSMAIGLLMGLAFAGWANNDALHCFFRKLEFKYDNGEGEKTWNWTKRTSFPSEWYSAFNIEKREVVLHFKDKDKPRLRGYPYEWPDHPDIGHFVLLEPIWLDEDNNQIPLSNTIRMLIPASSVEFVEMVKFWWEDHEPSSSETPPQIPPY